ncbi:hypothetical protein STCU_10572 [Strigomonas culicis]|uniref:Uncharacterized protein n=1 Tax=Strigomonas culicis TaxID=28005 RepID=S9TL28_9TRYP|nr:hypothetical protein STCU_10572 [Strigomonas culicis]|eukprot:EPY17514.1 hypothetical protein STCU_10572 [Strigomonas culicis]
MMTRSLRMCAVVNMTKHSDMPIVAYIHLFFLLFAAPPPIEALISSYYYSGFNNRALTLLSSLPHGPPRQRTVGRWARRRRTACCATPPCRDLRSAPLGRVVRRCGAALADYETPIATDSYEAVKHQAE